jgi:hypothetical protein
MEKLCTATDMLGLGFDAAVIRVVMHGAMSLLLLQCKKAARAGLDSESIPVSWSLIGHASLSSRSVPRLTKTLRELPLRVFMLWYPGEGPTSLERRIAQHEMTRLMLLSRRALTALYSSDKRFNNLCLLSGATRRIEATSRYVNDL